MQTYVGSFSAPTSTGNQSVTSLSFTPQLILFNITSTNTSVGTQAAMTYSFGAAASSSNQWWVGAATTNATTDFTGEEWYDETYCIGVLNTSGSVVAKASLSSFNSNGFTLDWAAVSAAYIVNFIAIGGVADAYVSYLTTTTSTGNQAITGVGFQPDIVFVFPFQSTQAPPTTSAQAQAKIGFGAFNSSQQGCSLMTTDVGSDTSYTYQRAEALASCTSSGTASNDATFVSMNSGGFTLDFTTATYARSSYFIALKGVQSQIGTITQPSSTGNQSVTGLSFEPSLVLLWSANKASSTSITTPAYFSIGAGTSSAQFAAWIGESSGSTTVSTSADIDHSNIIKMYSPNGASPTLNAAANLSSLGTSSFTLDWTTTNSTGAEVYYVALGQLLTTQTQTGKGRIQITDTKTQTGKARIQVKTLQTQTGKARIQITDLKTQQGKARIQATTTHTLNGVARIQQKTIQTQTGLARTYQEVVFLTSTNDTLLTTANQLSGTEPSSETYNQTHIVSGDTGWGEVFAQGSTTDQWAGGVTTEPSPSGNGFLWDTTELEGRTIIAGNWIGIVKLKTSSGSVSCVPHMRAYKRSSGGSYTLIAECYTSSTQSISTISGFITFPAVSASAVTFATGDKLYVDILLDVSSTTASEVRLYQNGGFDGAFFFPSFITTQTQTGKSRITGITQNTLTGVASINNTLLFRGLSPFQSSPDGVTWFTDTLASDNCYANAYLDGTWVALVADTAGGTGKTQVWTVANNGFTYTQQTTTVLANDIPYVLMTDFSQFVAVGAYTYTSSGGVNWTQTGATYLSDGPALYGACDPVNGRYMVMTGDGNVYESTNLSTNWNLTSYSGGGGAAGLVFGCGQFVAIPYTGTPAMFYSPDGTTWTACTLNGLSGLSGSYTCIGSFNNVNWSNSSGDKIVVMCINDTNTDFWVGVSTDGKTFNFTNLTAPTSGSLVVNVMYSGGIWLLAGQGFSWVSTDGASSWTLSNSNPQSQFLAGIPDLNFTVNQTLTGVARVQITDTETLTGKARIQITDTKTQTGHSRIQVSTAHTQTGVARITATSTRTQTGKARIQITDVETLTGKSRIQRSDLETLTGHSRIQVSTAHTQNGVARITATTTRTQTGTGRIQITDLKTVSGKSRLQVTTTNTLTGVAFIRTTTTTTQTQQGVARIQVVTDQTLTGHARIGVTTAHGQAGIARIAKTNLQTLAGIARIAKTDVETITGVGRIQRTDVETLTGKSRIQVATDHTQAGKARLQVVTDQNLQGHARIQVVTVQTSTGHSRIQILTAHTQSGLSRITATTAQTITGVAKIVVEGTSTETITGVARIQVTKEQTITGVGRVQITPVHTLAGKSRLQVETLRVLSGESRITAITRNEQTGHSRITAETTRTQTGIGRVQITPAHVQDGIARIQISPAHTLAGKSRLTVVTKHTQLGVARVTAHTINTQTGKARVQVVTDRTLMGHSRIFVATLHEQAGLARVTAKTKQTITGVAYINLPGHHTLTGVASIIAPTPGDKQIIVPFEDRIILVPGVDRTIIVPYRDRIVNPHK